VKPRAFVGQPKVELLEQAVRRAKRLGQQQHLVRVRVRVRVRVGVRVRVRLG
jgi:hypothetical protein